MEDAKTDLTISFVAAIRPAVSTDVPVAGCPAKNKDGDEEITTDENVYQPVMTPQVFLNNPALII
ncbi:MAG: hypothetical protein ACLR0F_26745 [Eisenbergiella sp.]